MSGVHAGSMSGGKERVERLVAFGKLTRAEADEILALGTGAERSGSPPAAPQPPRSAIGRRIAEFRELRARFLMGQLDEHGYVTESMRRIVRSTAWVFVLAWLALVLLALAAGEPLPRALLPASLILAVPALVYPVCWLDCRKRARSLGRMVRQADGALHVVANSRAGHCPTCDATDAQRLGWWHPLALSWLVNPVTVLPDLVFHQRLPRAWRDCRQCRTQFVDCAACVSSIDFSEFQDGMFARDGALRCPRCEAPLPVLRNLLAAALEAPVRLLRARPA